MAFIYRPPGKPNFNLLQQVGIAKSRVIRLSAKQIENADDILKTALKSKSYSSIITWTKQTNQASQATLEKLAKKAQTNCFIFCSH
ncbi:MAG TPA: hypothetical protein EYH12_00225 [Psychromonas hadalis]|nr:hypothetical protein [Psychromonas hadalis]